MIEIAKDIGGVTNRVVSEWVRRYQKKYRDFLKIQSVNFQDRIIGIFI
ncbi:hypothetical protein ACQKMD_11405 [Viridibacillus sp. NPDC096237]